MMQPIHTSLNYWLVAVSVLTSIVASYSAFSFADRVARSKGGSFFFWLLSGAFAMGLGIWSMHYLGMLAVRIPLDVIYHVPTVLLSLILAVVASIVVLVMVSRPELNARQISIGSVLMGSGIGAMHYTGMHAMRCGAMHRYRPALVLLSVVVAVAFSWLALWIAFSLQSNGERRELLRLGGAALMGLGIAAMHYTAMTAVTFMPDAMSLSTGHTVEISTIGIFGVAGTTAFVLFGALVTTLLDRSFYDRLSKERDSLRAVAESSLDCLYLCEALRNRKGEIEDFILTYLNSNVEKVSGTPLDTMLGHRMCEVLPVVRTLGHFELYKQVVVSGEPLVMEFPLPREDQEAIWMRIQAVKLRDGLAITAADITARKRDEDRILHLAHHDPLTGLINRSLLNDRIDQAIGRAKRYGGMVGVFLIDLDHFKQINDTLGHSAGDSVLVAVAARLTSAVRAIDSVIRIGGDEFVVVMPEIHEWSDLEQCALKFVSAFQPSIWIDGHSVQATASIGVSFYPDSGAATADLLAGADAAMYLAKRGGKNQFEIPRPKPDSWSRSYAPAVLDTPGL